MKRNIDGLIRVGGGRNGFIDVLREGWMNGWTNKWMNE